MLILTRRIGEKIAIGDDIFIKIIDIQGKQVKMGIDAPKECVIHREEIYEKIRSENEGAVLQENRKGKAVKEISRLTAQGNETIEFEGQRVPPDSVLHFHEGLIGFTHLTRYIIADLAEDPHGPFKWLQSLDDKDYSFLVTDPRFLQFDYHVQIAKEDVEDIKLKPESDDDIVLIILNYDNSGSLYANLRAPLLINKAEMLGKQIILDDTSLPTRHPVFDRNE